MKKLLASYQRLLALSIILALVLTLSATAIASATTHAHPSANTAHPTVCTIMATPQTQIIPPGHPATIAVTTSCPGSYLVVNWGDGTSATYPCFNSCSRTITHTYFRQGSYTVTLTELPEMISTTAKVIVIV